jgi:hypothetical protein
MSRHHLLTAVARALLLAGLLVVVAGQPCSGQVQGRQREVCTRASPTQVPHYTVSGTSIGDQFFLVDPSRNAVMTYDSGGRFLGNLPRATAGQIDKYFPATVKSRGKDLVVELANRHLVFLDHLYRPVAETTIAPRRQLALRRGSEPVTESLESMFLYELAGADVVACSDLKTVAGAGKPEWTSAIVRFPLDHPEEFRAFARSDFQQPEWLFCRLGLPLIAAVGDVGYVVLMNDQPGLYRIEPGATELKRMDDFPAERLQRPSLLDYSTVDEYAQVMDQVERVSMPAGIYGWKDRLFMLYRQVDGNGASSWELLRLDPMTGKILGTTAIASSAAFLQVIPGEKRWLILEKDRVLFLGNQRTRDFLSVDTEVFGRKVLPDTLCGSD